MATDITGLGNVADLVKTVIEKIWPDKSQQEKEQLAAAMLVVQGQLEINKAEAANPSVWVSGWRPGIGWCCGAACAWNWLGLPVAKFLLAILGTPIDISPADLTEMWPILAAMLGLGGLRTVEKVKGAEGNR